MTDEPSSQLDHLHRRPPVLDDTALCPMWIDPHDDEPSRIYWMDQYQEQLAVTQALRSDLSAARYQRDIWWPLGFCVGLICGIGLGVWLS